MDLIPANSCWVFFCVARKCSAGAGGALGDIRETRDIHPASQHCFEFQAAILHEMTLTLRIAGALLDSAEALNRNSHA